MTQIAGETWIGIRQCFGTPAGVAGDQRVVGSRLRAGVVFIAGGETEEVARQHQAYDLAATIGSKHAPANNACDNEIRIFGPFSLAADSCRGGKASSLRSNRDS